MESLFRKSYYKCSNDTCEKRFYAPDFVSFSKCPFCGAFLNLKIADSIAEAKRLSIQKNAVKERKIKIEQLLIFK